MITWNENILNFTIDSLLYGLILFIAYIVVSKVFARSNVWRMLIPVYFLKNYFLVFSI